MSKYDRQDPGSDPAYADGLGMTRSEPRKHPALDRPSDVSVDDEAGEVAAFVYEHPAFVRAKALPAGIQRYFPTSADEAEHWMTRHFTRALSSRVLVVAMTRIECAWSAYCDAVAGDNHDLEWPAVLAHGAKLDEATARALFPRFDGVPYAD